MIYLITNSKAFVFLNTKFNWCRKRYQFSCRHPDQRDNFRSNRRLLSSTLIVIRWMNTSGHKQTKLRVVHYFYQAHSIMIAFAFGLILQLGYRSMLLTKWKRESWDYEQSCAYQVVFCERGMCQMPPNTKILCVCSNVQMERNPHCGFGYLAHDFGLGGGGVFGDVGI